MTAPCVCSQRQLCYSWPFANCLLTCASIQLVSSHFVASGMHASKLLASAVPPQEADRKKGQPKKASMPAAVEAAVTAMKKLHCRTHATSSEVPHAAGSSAAQAAVGNIMHTTAVGDVSRSQPKQSAAGDTDGSNASQDTSANAAFTGTGEDTDTSMATSAEALKLLSIEAGLGLLHHTLKLDKLDADRLSSTHRKVVDAYRTGKLGRYTLDHV